MPTATMKASGSVKWYDPKKGYGFITRSGAQLVFLHYSQLRADEAQTIKAGDNVEFRLEPTEKGAIAREVQRIAGNKKK